MKLPDRPETSPQAAASPGLLGNGDYMVISADFARSLLRLWVLHILC
jgi:hypothetical protein